MTETNRIQVLVSASIGNLLVHHSVISAGWELTINAFPPGQVKKCTLVQALRLCTGRTAHRGSRGIALLFLDHGTIRGRGVSFTPRPLFNPGKDPVPIVQEAGWALGPIWTGAENLALTGIRSPDRPARSQLLYRLSYPPGQVLKEYCRAEAMSAVTGLISCTAGEKKQQNLLC